MISFLKRKQLHLNEGEKLKVISLLDTRPDNEIFQIVSSNEILLDEMDLANISDTVRNYLKIRSQPEVIEEFNLKIENSNNINQSLRICDKYYPNYVQSYIRSKKSRQVQSQLSILKAEDDESKRNYEVYVITMVLGLLSLLIAGYLSDWDIDIIFSFLDIFIKPILRL